MDHNQNNSQNCDYGQESLKKKYRKISALKTDSPYKIHALRFIVKK